jgi:hypothetical protein
MAGFGIGAAIGNEVFDEMAQAFPSVIEVKHIVRWPKELKSINW